MFMVHRMERNILLNLYKKKQTVFLLSEVIQMYPKLPYRNLRERMRYYVKQKKLRRLRAGIYAKTEYDPLELANKIYTPSYISLETILQEEGIIFQAYQRIFVISYLTREVKINGQEIIYRKIKDEILLNKSGIELKENYAIAIKERAFLDAVYLYKDYHFDNLSSLDWKKVAELKQIYTSKALEKRVEEYQQVYRQVA